MFGIKIKLPKVLKSVLKPIKAVTGAAGGAALLVPGVSQVAVGVQVADSLVKAANGRPPGKGLGLAEAMKLRISQGQQAKAKAIVANTRKLAVSSPNPAVRRAAANGLTLMRKRTAAMKAAKCYKVVTSGPSKGRVVKVR